MWTPNHHSQMQAFPRLLPWIWKHTVVCLCMLLPFIGSNGALKASRQVCIYELGSHNYRVRCVHVTLVSVRWLCEFTFHKFTVSYRPCIRWFHHVFFLTYPNLRTRGSKKIQSFSSHKYNFVVAFMCIQLIWTIFLTWLERCIRGTNLFQLDNTPVHKVSPMKT